MKRWVLLCMAMIAAGNAAAQSADTPLDLSVPEDTVASAAADDAVAQGDPPGAYHGDTSGKPSRPDTDETAAADDGKAKVWGSFTTGIGHTKGYGTSHYNAAEVNVSKSFGDGEYPSAINLQIRVEQGDGPGFGGPYSYPYPYPYYDRDSDYFPR